MDFEFSTEQEMLRTSVRALLADRAPMPSVRAAYDSGAFDRDAWKGLADLGVLDLGMVDAAVVLEELGRAVSPMPYASSAIGARALVPGLDAIGALAIFETGRRYDWRAPAVQARPDNDVWRLDGAKVHVADAAAADVFVVTARDREGNLAVFTTESARVEPSATIDGTRHSATVVFESSAAQQIVLDNAEAAIARAIDRLGVAYVVDGVGAAARAMELAVEYAKERVQFDRPIGSFQAVQHLCADMLRTVELGPRGGLLRVLGTRSRVTG